MFDSLKPDTDSRAGSILLVSADRSWLASATAFLVAEARSLSTAETATEALDMAMNHPPDVVVVAPPVQDGSPLSLITQLTSLRSRGPLGIVYVSDREREVAEHSRLMKAGTNDWFPRGIAATEAARRVAALLTEIVAPPGPRDLVRGPLRLDVAMRRAVVGEASVELTPAEFRILEALALAAGRIMTAREIAGAIGARRGSRLARSIGQHVELLRDKLGAARGLLECSRRDGYRLRFVAPP